MLGLAPCEFYLTELGLDSSAPSGFVRPGYFLPYVAQRRAIHSQYMAQPSDSSAFDVHAVLWQPVPGDQFFFKGLGDSVAGPVFFSALSRIRHPTFFFLL